MKLFQSLGDFISNILMFLNNSSVQDIIQAFAGLMGVTVTLWIIIEAYKVIAGRSDKPTQDLVWKMASAMLVISVATNSNGFLDVLKGAFEELHYMMSGDISLYAKLDKLFDETIKFANSTYKAAPSGLFGAIVGGLCIIIVYAGFLVSALPIFLIIVFSELTLKILLFLLPIAIFSLAFNFSKQIWVQWLNMFVSNSLTILIVGILMNAVINSYIDWQVNLGNQLTGYFDVIALALMSFISGIIVYGLTKVSQNIAEKLALVSLDSLGQSAATSAFDEGKKRYGQGVKGAITTMKGARVGAKYVGGKIASSGRPSSQAYSGDAV
ncbi:type IV secretion system protein [Aliarcobacter lanthieri]|uniref:type IV secretion system protein n=1 Tax=Aliarcobacter lanthieri TaxID=1355374 RepID=UPI00047AAB4F|nr:type IV secretion system protein [Aliarcobacter lanthieri]